jgi:pimeloyl-ACP methyl ester carboxylesterase
MNSTTIVLLHGSGMGRWIWDRTTSHLRHTYLALDVPSRHIRATPSTCAATLVETMDQQGVMNVMLVAHSLSGVLVPELAERLGPRLKCCLYVGAVIPKPGQSFAGAMGFITNIMLRVLFRLHPKGLKPSETMMRKELCNDLDEATTKEVVKRFDPEFPGLFLTPVGVYPEVKCIYVRLMKDKSVPPELQQKMAQALPRVEVVELDAGHMAMLSKPEKLAAIINDLCATGPG